MNNVTTFYALKVASPLGMLQLVSDANYLVELNWQGAHKRVNSAAKPAAAILVAAANELSQFFDGERRHFSVPVDPRGTDFQLSANQSFWTQARENLNVTTLIFANHSYNILNVEYARLGVTEVGEIAASLFDIGNPDLDWVAMAKGFGVPGAHAKDAEDLCRLLEESYKTPGPFVIQARA